MIILHKSNWDTIASHRASSSNLTTRFRCQLIKEGLKHPMPLRRHPSARLGVQPLADMPQLEQIFMVCAVWFSWFRFSGALESLRRLSKKGLPCLECITQSPGGAEGAIYIQLIRVEQNPGLQARRGIFAAEAMCADTMLHRPDTILWPALLLQENAREAGGGLFMMKPFLAFGGIRPAGVVQKRSCLKDFQISPQFLAHLQGQPEDAFNMAEPMNRITLWVPATSFLNRGHGVEHLLRALFASAACGRGTNKLTSAFNMMLQG